MNGELPIDADPSSRFVLFVRHGESRLNQENRKETVFCGQMDSPLTETGEWQAARVGEFVRGLSFPGWKPGRAVSSQLQRARKTLEIILRYLPEVRCLPPAKELNERSLGLFEGRTEREVFAENPDFASGGRYANFRNDWVQKAPGGENLAEVTARVVPFLKSLVEGSQDDLLVVAHIVSIRCFIGEVLGWSVAQRSAWKLGNAGIVALSVDERNTWKLCMPARDAHLANRTEAAGQ